MYGVVALFIKRSEGLYQETYIGGPKGGGRASLGDQNAALFLCWDVFTALLGRVHGVASMSGRVSFDGGFNLCRRSCPPSMPVGGIRCAGGTTRAPQTRACL
jgi:hypothetical protein